MKPFYHLALTILSWLVLSPCICHPTLGRNRTSNIQCIDSDRDALLQFKHGVTTDYCGLLTSWEPDTDCCRWQGVVCSNLTSHVVKLNLIGHDDVLCLEGKVSPSLGEVKHLEHLDLSNNNFSGEIPHQLGNLSMLKTLDLNFAYPYVSVQSLTWISRLSLLRYLDLSGNNLSEVRNWIAIINNLPSLRVLSMDYCSLSQEIPSSISYVNSSATLQNVSLFSNSFKDGSILNWLFNFSRITTQLVHLDLSENDFDGPILREIGNLRSLSYLELSSNNFKGPIPSEIGNLHSLSYLDLSYNAFQGNVFKIISKLCYLEELHLAKNNFTDDLSNVIHSLVNCNNKALLVLDLSSNGFSGEIPDDIGSLSSLTELNLGSNQLKGEISPGIRQLSMLEKLDSSSNYLEGTLTRTFFSKLVNLRQLSLSDNLELVISIEEDWIPPFKLDVIQLRSCRLGPRFPKWLQLQTNVLQYIDVSNTSIFDSVPVSFWNSLSSNLLYLNMSYNQIYGMLPNLPQLHKPFISNSFEAEIIDLSSNLFEGVVPSGFGRTGSLFLNDNKFSNCSNILCPKTGTILEHLDLSNNLFYGELPDCWMSFSYLTSLHLENNRFSGSMPKSINTLSSLEYLHLYNNSFSGPFPVAFESLISLVILNLGYNSFSGNIPSWIGNASQSLRVLILRENHFIGEIPESICQLNSSQILDLASNHLSGVIPNCIGNFTAMKGAKNLELDSELDAVQLSDSAYGIKTRIESVIVSWKREEQRFKGTIRFVKYIDLSSNELSGKIPDGISSLTAIEALDLSENKLSGNIPFEIGNLTALEFLDLSNNHLSGEIPISLAKVTTLDVMNVSNNHLSGEIPVSTQLQSFDVSSYAGNSGLCGAPLPTCSKDRAPSNLPNGDKNSVRNKDNDFCFFLGLYISVVLGFIVGFWGVFGTLIIKTSWRHAYFRLLDNIKDRIM